MTTPSGFCSPDVHMGISTACCGPFWQTDLGFCEPEEVSECRPLLLVLHPGVMKAHMWTWKICPSSAGLVMSNCHKPSPLKLVDNFTHSVKLLNHEEEEKNYAGEKSHAGESSRKGRGAPSPWQPLFKPMRNHIYLCYPHFSSIHSVP